MPARSTHHASISMVPGRIVSRASVPDPPGPLLGADGCVSLLGIATLAAFLILRLVLHRPVAEPPAHPEGAR